MKSHLPTLITPSPLVLMVSIVNMCHYYQSRNLSEQVYIPPDLPWCMAAWHLPIIFCANIFSEIEKFCQHNIICVDIAIMLHNFQLNWFCCILAASLLNIGVSG